MLVFYLFSNACSDLTVFYVVAFKLTAMKKVCSFLACSSGADFLLKFSREVGVNPTLPPQR
ncbi:protein of unknown function [Moritella yayanosii]|uniref:Uncharacterized protein n=1 Tax=Moritella yayanosii TaxID=69539 RepID=A0A330LQN6_9GAMM|nr:protein of unknown function [Moritella yayanosii]